MSGQTAGQVALVVGGSSGMGRAIAKTLATAGFHVVAAARRAERLEALKSELAQQGTTLDVATLDATQRSEVEKVVTAVENKFGRLNLLVYATGTNTPQRAIAVLSTADWDELIATNLTGAFHCTQAVLPVMRRGGGGLIVYLSSGAVQMPDVSGVAYQASKHGLTGLAHGTRVEERQHRIRTTVIFPGLCETEILLKRPSPTPREVLDLALEPQDVADAVLFVAQLPPRAVVPEMQLLPSRL